MVDPNILINSCYQFITSQSDIVTIAKYSHIIPVVLSLFLGFFVLFKAKYNLLSKLFFSFVFTFSIWLIGDLITWTSTNYHIIYSTWSFLVFLEIIFYVLGLYFVLVFAYKKDISIVKKILLFLLVLPPFIITVTKKSVLGFDQAFCGAINNDSLGVYKLLVEFVLMSVMLIYIIKISLEKIAWKRKRISIIMVGSMFLYLFIFSVAEYLSSVSGIYQYTLYSLFLLPVFLLVIIYSVFELDIFHFRLLGTQYLVIGLAILVAGQLFFVSGTSDRLLTIMTLVILFGLSIILFRNLKKESDQRLYIENLTLQLNDYNDQLEVANEKLKGLDKLKSEFVSLASHQLRSPLTAIRGYTSMIMDGDYGEIKNEEANGAISKINESSINLSKIVEDLLNVTKIEQGGMKYEMVPFALPELAKDVVGQLSIIAQNKNLEMTYSSDDDVLCQVVGDKEKLRQVIINFVDNSIKYTKEGSVKVSVRREKDKVVFKIVDTGVGMNQEIKETLFHKFARGDGARMNTTGSGLGLYLCKEIAEAHGGRVYVESEGPGLGSTFVLELKAI